MARFRDIASVKWNCHFWQRSSRHKRAQVGVLWISLLARLGRKNGETSRFFSAYEGRLGFQLRESNSVRGDGRRLDKV
jgi:hypothetical protein